MTVDEAVLLVLQAGALGEGGDVLVLAMGKPVRIVDLAARLARQTTPDLHPRIVYTGLRDGEKLHERLVSTDDIPLERPHPRISRYWIPSGGQPILESECARLPGGTQEREPELNGPSPRR